MQLCVGAGNGVDTACLMTATNMLIGKPELLDKEGDCICPFIANFVRQSNDAIGTFDRKLLNDLYSPLVWELPGTRNPDSVPLREKYLLNWLLELLTPQVHDIYAVCRTRYGKSVEAVRKMYADSGTSWLPQNVIAFMRIYASFWRSTDIFHHCPDLIRGMAAIGDRRPVETVMTQEELEACLI